MCHGRLPGPNVELPGMVVVVALPHAVAAKVHTAVVRLGMGVVAPLPVVARLRMHAVVVVGHRVVEQDTVVVDELPRMNADQGRAVVSGLRRMVAVPGRAVVVDTELPCMVVDQGLLVAFGLLRMVAVQGTAAVAELLCMVAGLTAVVAGLHDTVVEGNRRHSRRLAVEAARERRP